MTMDEIDALVRENIGRKVRVAGACIGTDAHTVGIDAILNMKGYKGDYGLERYHEFETYNLGSQVAVEDRALHERARDRRAARVASRHAERQRHQELHRNSASCSRPKAFAIASC